MNALTERQRCRRECCSTWWRKDGFFDYGDARECEHGRWWFHTGDSDWRPATWLERRRARKAGASA